MAQFDAPELHGDDRVEDRARERALTLAALCVGGMVLARNVCDRDLADNFRRAAHAEVLRAAGWN